MVYFLFSSGVQSLVVTALEFHKLLGCAAETAGSIVRRLLRNNK